MASIEKLAALIETVHRLRAPGGCPWDRAQTHQSLRPYLIEEAYEVLDVLDRVESEKSLTDETIRGAFREELGDLLMQVLLHSEMTKEHGAFDIYDVAEALNDKLVRRHPHVFGEVKADSAETAFQTWEKQKAKEKAGKKDASILDGVPKGLPTLQRASRVIEKVTKVGFQWKDLEGPIEKLEEELAEFKEAIRESESASAAADAQRSARGGASARIEEELGDLLFSLANVSFLMKLNPEDALRATLRKFERRFKHVESRLREQGKMPEQSNLEEMDGLWNEAKRLEK
jgi:tetrapyrrole methylase family protein/MazG family protein